MHLQSGTLLKRGEYRIINSIGRGGFGITYLAEQVNLHRKVCVKEFFPEDYYKRDEDSVSISLLSESFKENMSRFKTKFIKEAQTIATLNHANIIPIYDVFEENGTAYYVMEYIEGESLSDIVKRGGAMSEHDAVGYIKQVAAALEHIHEQQIMHLDVKPGNIMVRTKDSRSILIDFGLSKHYDAESGDATSTTPVGVSHGFAPMEQYKQGGVSKFSPETDIYSLGATLYYLVTGKVPPQAADIADDGLPTLPANLSSSVRTAIERSMAEKRKDRPHSIKEFLALLDNVKPVVEVLVADDERTKITAVTDDEKTKIVAPQPKVEQPKVQIDREPKLKQKTERPKRRWWQWLLGLLTIFALYINFGLWAAGCYGLCVFGLLFRFRWWQWLLGYLVLIGFAFLYDYHNDADRRLYMEKMEHAVEARNAELHRIADEEAYDNMIVQGLGRDGVYEVGDYYNKNGKEGVVFEVSADGCHGKIVSLDEAKLLWCTDEQYCKGIKLGSTNEKNGKVNTDVVMERDDKDQYPAFVWCREKGADWYLPAIEEIETICSYSLKINTTLSKHGGTELSFAWKWSSTEHIKDVSGAWSAGQLTGELCLKNTSLYVRAVSAF